MERRVIKTLTMYSSKYIIQIELVLYMIPQNNSIILSLSPQTVLFLMCAGNELFHLMVYMMYFSSGPLSKMAT